MSHSRATIIVPSLDNETTMEACLTSLIRQEMKEIEILCIDAGSMDGTLRVVERLEREDRRIRFLSSRRKSCGDLLNIGIEQAKGEYVVFLSPSSTVAPSMCRELIQLADDEQLDFIESGYTSKDGTGSVACGQTVNPAKDQSWASSRSIVEGCLYRRSFLEKHGIRFSELPGMEIPSIGFRFRSFLKATKVLFWEEDYCCRDAHPEEDAGNVLREYDFLLSEMEQDSSLRQQFGESFGRLFCLEILSVIDRLPREKKKDFLKRAAVYLKELHDAKWIDYYGLSQEEREKLSRTLLDPIRYGEDLLREGAENLEERIYALDAQLAGMKKSCDAMERLTFLAMTSEAFGILLRAEKRYTEWFKYLAYAAKNYLVIFAVKDTPGNSMPHGIKNYISEAGFDLFQTDLWRTYIGVIYRGRNVTQQFHEKEVRTDFSYESLCFNLSIDVTSQAWRQGNRGEILINGKDWAVGLRGVNIVIYDVEKGQVLDSIGFDSHEADKIQFVHRQEA